MSGLSHLSESPSLATTLTWFETSSDFLTYSLLAFGFLSDLPAGIASGIDQKYSSLRSCIVAPYRFRPPPFKGTV